MNLHTSLKGKIRRVLFDLDGTLYDTQKHHAEEEARLLAENHVPMKPESVTARFAGRPTESVFMETLSCTAQRATVLANIKWKRLFPKATEAKKLELCDIGLLFAELRKRKISYAIGTASPVTWARRLIVNSGLADYIPPENIIGGDMVQEGKPHPSIWNHAAGGVAPQDCLVVEDGTAGILAALRAGMPCALILPRTHPHATPIRSAKDVLELV